MTQFKDPWRAPLNQAERDFLEKSLRRSLNRDSPWKGRNFRLLARRDDCDDALFQLEGETRVTVVHLTYVKNERPGYPDMHDYASLAAFIEETDGEP